MACKTSNRLEKRVGEHGENTSRKKCNTLMGARTLGLDIGREDRWTSTGVGYL